MFLQPEQAPQLHLQLEGSLAHCWPGYQQEGHGLRDGRGTTKEVIAAVLGV